MWIGWQFVHILCAPWWSIVIMKECLSGRMQECTSSFINYSQAREQGVHPFCYENCSFSSWRISGFRLWVLSKTNYAMVITWFILVIPTVLQHFLFFIKSHDMRMFNIFVDLLSLSSKQITYTIEQRWSNRCRGLEDILGKAQENLDYEHAWCIRFQSGFLLWTDKLSKNTHT